ncbi:MAG: hypothetical protein R2716_07610 [Microthrixaceae bacterium]
MQAEGEVPLGSPPQQAVLLEALGDPVRRGAGQSRCLDELTQAPPPFRHAVEHENRLVEHPDRAYC